RFILSALLFSLAAQQNPPIGIPAVFALLLQFFITTKLFLKNKIPMTPAIKTYVALGGISLILLLSPLFYYWHFHTTNLIVKYGGSIHNLISLKRLYSIYFDYNQGIIVASLFAMIIIFFLILLYAVIPALRQRFKTKQHIIIALLMLILSIVIAIPALSAPNWNPGQCIFLRYGYWISMPLGVAAMLLIAELPLCFYLPTFLFFILGQSLILYKHTITGREDYLENKPIAIYFFENYPNLYNPIPVIFIERGLHTETGADINKIYLYVNKNSKITKILYHQSNFSPTILCQNQSINDLRKSNVSVATEQGWFYINFTNNSCSTDYQPGFHSI
ncbi:MAG: hypothetical protein JO131_06715, partial [Gammaproteobacteria bacterium]|nr:hypothetical protein [Gammaproteobacteria bacterium]